MSPVVTETEYVTQKALDLQLENIKTKINVERERAENRFEKNQAVMDKKIAELKTDVQTEVRNILDKIHAEISDIHAEISDIHDEIKDVRSDIKVLDAKIEGTNTRIDGLEKRFDDMKEYQNKWFTVFGFLFTVAAIVAPVAVAVVQHFMTR